MVPSDVARGVADASLPGELLPVPEIAATVGLATIDGAAVFCDLIELARLTLVTVGVAPDVESRIGPSARVSTFVKLSAWRASR